MLTFVNITLTFGQCQCPVVRIDAMLTFGKCHVVPIDAILTFGKCHVVPIDTILTFSMLTFCYQMLTLH
jgi:hypothetical protein